jgi:hypothetical protein
MGVMQQQYTDQGHAAAPAGPSSAANGTVVLDLIGGACTGRSERRPSRAERRPSRSERRASAAAVAAAVAGYSTDTYWNSRYAERSTHFDWFFNYSALADLVNTTCDSQAGPCLHVGCGNSGFSEGMTLDGFEVRGAGCVCVCVWKTAQLGCHPGAPTITCACLHPACTPCRCM